MSARDTRPTRFTSLDRGNSPPRFLFPILILGLLFSAGVGVYLLTAVTITINLDGQSIPIRTHQTTVGAVLNENGLWLENADRVQPARDTPISSGLTITIDRASPVAIDVDGQSRRFLTHATDPKAILAEAGIVLGINDVVQADLPSEIVVRRAHSVQVQDGAHNSTLHTTATTVGAALAEAGITFYTADTITPDTTAEVTDGLVISINRSQPVTIQVDGRTLDTRTRGQTVGAVLNEAGIALVGLDRCEPPIDQAFTPGSTIRVIRVTETEEVTQVALPFALVVQPDASLAPGQQRVIQAGTSGQAEIYVRVRREDGVEVSRSMPLRFVIQPPQDRIVAANPVEVSSVTLTPFLTMTTSPIPTSTTTATAR